VYTEEMGMGRDEHGKAALKFVHTENEPSLEYPDRNKPQVPKNSYQGFKEISIERGFVRTKDIPYVKNADDHAFSGTTGENGHQIREKGTLFRPLDQNYGDNISRETRPFGTNSTNTNYLPKYISDEQNRCYEPIGPNTNMSEFTEKNISSHSFPLPKYVHYSETHEEEIPLPRKTPTVRHESFHEGNGNSTFHDKTQRHFGEEFEDKKLIRSHNYYTESDTDQVQTVPLSSSNRRNPPTKLKQDDHGGLSHHKIKIKEEPVDHGHHRHRPNNQVNQSNDYSGSSVALVPFKKNIKDGSTKFVP
jgi:hypothetical protein